MKNTRMGYHRGQGDCDAFLNLLNGEIFTAYDVPEYYDPVEYYRSRAGHSAAGYMTKNTVYLVPIGQYRACGEVRVAPAINGWEVFVDSWDGEMPTIIINRVCKIALMLANNDDVIKVVRGGLKAIGYENGTVDLKRIDIEYIDVDGDINDFSIYINNAFRGVNVMMFFDSPEDKFSGELEDIGFGFMDIFVAGEHYCVPSNQGYNVKYFQPVDGDALHEVHSCGGEFNGWNSIGSGRWFKRTGDEILTMKGECYDLVEFMMDPAKYIG